MQEPRLPLGRPRGVMSGMAQKGEGVPDHPVGVDQARLVTGKRLMAPVA